MPHKPGRTFPRHLHLVAVCAAAALAVSACSLGGGSNKSASTDQNAITVDLPNYPATFDPGLQYDTSSYTVYRNIFDQLLRRDPTSHEVVPGVADSWKQTDPTTWTFTIHNGIKFSNGEALTADDVAFSINRILDKNFNSPQFANFSTISSATASGNTLTVATHTASPTLLSYLTTLSVVPKDYVGKVGNDSFNAKPIGSGPYLLASQTAGSTAVLTANPHYWKAKPQVGKVTFRAVPNVATRVADLKSGRADLVTGLTPDTAKELSGDNKTQVLSSPTERVAYLAFNTMGDTPTKNVKVRQAIAYAIDYNSIISNLLGGFGKPVKTVLTPLSFGYPDNVAGYSYDPDKAKALLAASGVKSPELVFPSSPSYNPQLIQAIQANLEAVGFKVSISNTDQATYLKKVQSPKHDWGSVRFGRWSCSCLDADGTIYPLFHTGTIWSSFTDQTFDTAVEQARGTTDEAARTAAYTQAFDVIQAQVPGIGLYQDYAIYGAAADITWQPDAQENFFVADVRLGG
ncbi:MAG TPA: ABC transporter substrate-binding protein [Mycobacteriales bacterium]|nr:ABC transporter substrate-binding protein [Mycobacteriales bacterium]